MLLTLLSLSGENYGMPDDVLHEEMGVPEVHIGYMVDDGVDLEDPDSAECAAQRKPSFVGKEQPRRAKGFRGPPPTSRCTEVSGSLSLKERKEDSILEELDYVPQAWSSWPLERGDSQCSVVRRVRLALNRILWADLGSLHL